MKTTDHNIDYLRRSLRDEATSLRERAKRLDSLASQMVENVREGLATVYTFEYVAQEAISTVTHRSNVHVQSIARYGALAAADAAVEWAEKKRAAV